MADVGSMNIEEGQTLQRPPSLSLDPNNTSSMDADPYDDASSSGVYTLDDIDIGETSTDDINVGETSLDDVYSDCVTTLLEAVPDADFERSIESSVNTIVDVTEVSNIPLNNNTKVEGKSPDGQAPPAVYFELETVSDRQDSVITPDMQPSVQEITQAFEALSGDHLVQGLKKQSFDDDFTPVLHDIPPSENPFEGFEVVDDTAPVYEQGKPKSGETTDTVGDQTVGVSLSGTGEANGEISERILSEPIYDVVPSRDSSERGSGHSYMSLLPEEPIYEVVCHDTTANGQTGSKVKGQGQCKGGSHGNIPAPPPGLGSVYSVAKGAVDKSQNQTNLPSNLAKGAATSSMYDMAKPIPAGFAAESVLTRDDFMVRSHPPGFVSCKQGSGRPFSVHFLENAGAARKGLKTPPKALEDGDYDRLKFRRFNSKKLKSRSQFYIGYNGEDDMVPEDFPPQDVSPEPEPVVSQDQLYESISSSHLSEDGWGSSEFEESGEDEVLEQAPAKPLPPEPKQSAKIINRIRSLGRKNNVNMDEEMRCFPVDLNPSKHPPPELPPPPDDLSESQKKRRCVVDLTISSEKSYINALERITEDYMKVVMENIASPRSHVKMVFAEAEQILSHHKMFQIELADRVRKWDQEGKIGDIFTASFSKTMLLNSYSVYVNSFAAAMEEIKTVQRTKQTFSDFLRAKESSSSDRLSIFGLMVKPVQRFPQFIMLLQDLLKYTPQTHHDRGALQLALTELENVTHKLNERKRHSEQQFAARQITSQLSRQLVMKVTESPRRLLRQDDMEQVVGETASMKSKKVRVFLMNDTVLFVKVGFKDQGGYPTERYRLKWMANIRDVEVKDSAITPDMESVVKGGPGKMSIYSTQIDKPEEDPFHLFADLNEMLHDFPVLTQISALVSTLKRSYMGLTEELTQELRRDLQRLIHIKDEQLRLVNSCSIILSDYTKNEKIRYVLQTPTASIKHEWCMDFLIAKLATDKQNNPGWGDMGNEEDEDLPPAFFMRCLPVDVPRNYTKMMCAIPVFMTSSSGTRLGIQHLWVVTTTATRGQVSIISIHNSKPSLTESFKAADVEVTCTEHIPGYAKDVKEYAYEEDCVWLGTIDNEILIFPLTSSDGMRREAVAKFTLPAAPVSMKYVDERIFCGLVNGSVAVFSRDKDGAWNVNSPHSLNLSNTIISCMKVIDDDLWVALTTKILVLEIDSLKERTTHDLSSESEELIIHEFTTSGVGIWVSFKDSAKLRLYHTETLENLQEINIASAVNRLLEERKSKVINGDQLDGYSSCVITSLSASKGLLWIGTNHGFVLTLPLPRLKDGVPLASGRPKISLHSHRGPVKFLIPIYYSSSVAELNRNSSLWSSLRPKRPSLNDRATVVNQNKTEGITSPVSDSGTDGVISPDGKSHSETWQAEIDKLSAIGENTGESPVIGQTETASESNSVLQPIAEVDTSNSNDKSNSAKTPQSARRRKSVKDSESLKKDKPKRLKSKTLSFRSELANKIAKRNFESSDSELADEEEDEVRLLYENLMETDDDMEQENEDDSFQDAISSFEELPSDLGSPENALSARKDGQTVKWGSEVRLRATSASVRSRHGTLHRGGSTQAHKTATMRKNPCNAVIVVGGGDGYVDWNKTTKQRTSEDASLLLWIYKL